MLKSIFLLSVLVVLFSGCHRFNPVIGAVIAVPAIIVSPFFDRRHHHHNRHYNNRGSRAYGRHRGR